MYKENKVKRKELNLKEEEEKSDIFQKLGVLGKLYNIIIHTCNLAGRIKEFESLAKRKILFNNYIKWNSWYFMLNIAI